MNAKMPVIPFSSLSSMVRSSAYPFWNRKISMVWVDPPFFIEIFLFHEVIGGTVNQFYLDKGDRPTIPLREDAKPSSLDRDSLFISSLLTLIFQRSTPSGSKINRIFASTSLLMMLFTVCEQAYVFEMSAIFLYFQGSNDTRILSYNERAAIRTLISH